MKFFAVLSAVLVVALGVTSTTAAAAAADIAPDANTMETFFLAPVSMETVGSLALLECGSMKSFYQHSTTFSDTLSIEFVIYDGKPSKTVVSDVIAVRESIDKTHELGKSKPTEPLTVRSTGPSKGVCITHANLVAPVGAVYTFLGHHLNYDDAYLAIFSSIS
ncbi:hypothetical protein EV368DRAFT_87943 [Lentinula lateritia]|nr:hypothetical protein EV368DRAFT_87943 [Lentinula lateritia]